MKANNIGGKNKYGTLDKSYHLGRKTSKALIYRLKRRTEEVTRSTKEHYSRTPERIIDLGTADGLMLSKLKDAFPSTECIGIEYSLDLVQCNTDSRITVTQGDVNYLSQPDNSFDIVVATAVIEHLPNPKRMLREVERVLRPNGLIILTTPDPFWERIATMVGHLPDEKHYKVMKVKELFSLLMMVFLKYLNIKNSCFHPLVCL